MSTTKNNKNIYLVGFMGAGKTTVGKLLSEKLNRNYYDLDVEIEKAENVKINELFERRGEKYFRVTESNILYDLSNNKINSIISTGGGVVIREENWKVMKEFGRIVYLKANLGTLWNRVKNSKTRPLLNVDNSYEKAGNLFNERKEIYKRADYIVETDNLSVKCVVNCIVELVN